MMLDIEASHGFNILNATKTGSNNLSRENGWSDFTKFNVNTSAMFGCKGFLEYIGRTLKSDNAENMGKNCPGFSLKLSAAAQHSAQPLLAPERFSLGGLEFGRGYDPSELTGDHGAAFKTELQWGRAMDMFMVRDLQLYAFYDIGKVWELTYDPDFEKKQQSLASAGAGLRANLNDFSLNMELAKPLTRTVATLGKKPWRKYVSLQYRFEY